jgi:rfaE bifunctional protein nucleotidyltransferase chain/domain
VSPVSRAPIVDLAAAVRHVERFRSSGKIVVLANGAFDPFHVGHLRYLEGARQEGDLLMVAINSDTSVRRLKGEGRPVMPAAERAELVSGLRAVDLVMIFDADTVADLLLRLRPDVHAKGTDYTPQTVPEKDVVASYGGRVVITGDPKDHDSSALIQRIRRQGS